MAERLRLGEMLKAAQLVTDAQVDEALQKQGNSGQKLGEILVDMGCVAEATLAQILSNQLSIPWVNLQHIEFTSDLLNMVHEDTAKRFNMIPVYIRKTRDRGQTLFIATDDPLNNEAIEAAERESGYPVKPMVAGATDIRDAISDQYRNPFAEEPTVLIKRRSGEAPFSAPPMPPKRKARAVEEPKELSPEVGFEAFDSFRREGLRKDEHQAWDTSVEDERTSPGKHKSASDERSKPKNSVPALSPPSMQRLDDLDPLADIRAKNLFPIEVLRGTQRVYLSLSRESKTRSGTVAWMPEPRDGVSWNLDTVAKRLAEAAQSGPDSLSPSLLAIAAACTQAVASNSSASLQQLELALKQLLND